MKNDMIEFIIKTGSVKMKPEKTSLIKIGYHKETLKNHRFLGRRKFIEFSSENKYFATFKIQGLDKKKIGRIIMYCEVLKHQKGRKIYINEDKVYFTDFFEVAFFESMYPHMVKPARKGVIPERIESSILDVEVDLCMMEHDVDFSVRRAPDLIRKYELESNSEV